MTFTFARSLSATVAAAVVASLPVFLVGALAVQLTGSLRFDSGALGIAISLYFLGAAASSVPMSQLAERIGAIRIMKAACGLIGVLCLILGLAVDSWAGLVAVMIPAGVANGALQPAINQFISNRVRHDRQGLIFGLKQSAIPFCALLGGVSVPLVALTLGWRWAFIMAAAGAVVAGLALPRPNATRRIRIVNVRMPGKRAFPLAILTVGFALGLAGANGLTGFIVIASVASGVSVASAGLLLALGSVAAIIARIGLGALADRRRIHALPAVCVMLALGSAGLLLLATSAAVGPTFLLVPGVVLAFAAGWGWNGLFNLALIRNYPDRPAFATGVVQTGGRIGGFVGPLLFGLVATESSYSVAYLCTALMLGAGACVMTVGWQTLKRWEI